MSKTIAISGKGGSGKTTLAAMIIRLLCSQSQDAILAVDADPNSCLAPMMGVEPEDTIAEIREQTRQKQPSNEGMDRLRSLEYGLQQAITEATGFDLLTMGRPEGPSCYCAVNNMLRTFLDKLSTQYQYVIIDNEAGMEHLSRRTTNNVDLLCIVAEPTALGTLTARRISELAKQLPISVKEIGVIWNRAQSCKKLDGIETFGYVPYDKATLDASMQGQTVFDLEENSAALSAVRKILECKLNRNFQLSKNQN
ncbi:MAG TPA: AAA family ATPase [Sedimentisphaerales bacterium]|nr:AAA family ATPase [Sedimentisphaerales bacterium]